MMEESTVEKPLAKVIQMVYLSGSGKYLFLTRLDVDNRLIYYKVGGDGEEDCEEFEILPNGMLNTLTYHIPVIAISDWAMLAGKLDTNKGILYNINMD